jgi:pimeloyl-ACP methyl ester carboxylesterase
VLDTHIDWVLAVRQIVEKAGLAGADLLGASVGAAFAAEMAAIFPRHVRKLALIAPFGLFDEADPAADPWAQRKDAVAGLMCADPAKWEALISPPAGANSIEWPIEMTRASEAAARAFWPLGNTRLEKRLGLIEAPTLVLWGDRDAVLPPTYADKFASGINGSTKVQTVAGAGHLAYLDQPEAVARAVLEHLS